MSSNNTTYNTSFDQTRSPINSSRLGLPAASLSPGTFRTNVNRAKSKRWVEAKTVDYGGGGWGGDGDFDDEDHYDPPPMGGRGSAWQRSNSFDRGDDVVSPVIGSRGNGSAVPRIETTDVEITQPLPPTPLELEQRERALRGQSPPSHPQHRYPMQPKPQLLALPYTPSTTSGPARTPPLPTYGGASVPSPPPPPPLREIGAPGRDVVPPPLGMGPGPSPVSQPYANFAPFTQSLASAEKPLPIRKASSPTSGGEIARANPSSHLTPSPSPPPPPRRRRRRQQNR
ncbi:hypothetical protein HOY80DRAFT_707284 [Tuber brumale]|nr:hypothetical protein HOY80DRAFT_707284 [Tuber brumale]